MTIMSDYWLNQATSLQATSELLVKEVARLEQYESMVHFIANDYIELSCMREIEEHFGVEE